MRKILIDELEARTVLELLESAHVATNLVWIRNDCCEVLREALAEQPAQQEPLTEERIWEIKLKSHHKFMSKKWIEETDFRSGYYEDVELHTDSPVTFARAIEAAHGIKEKS